MITPVLLELLGGWEVDGADGDVRVLSVEEGLDG